MASATTNATVRKRGFTRNPLREKSGAEYTPTDQDFTAIDFPGAMQMTSLGINNFGDIVGDYRLSDGLFDAYVLSKGQFTFLEPLLEAKDITESFAIGINSWGDLRGPKSEGADPPLFTSLPCCSSTQVHAGR